MHMKSFLLISLLALSSAKSKMHPTKNLLVTQVINEKTVLLEYVGTLTGSFANYNIGVQLILDTSIGFRYDVTIQNGNAVLSHAAIFYKFSNPYQSIHYNYLNRRKEIIKQTSGKPNNNVNVVGKETIDSFACTHLNHTGDYGSEDYWMSTSVPGFQQLIQILKFINPAFMSYMNETIFKWGGLVRIRMVANYPQAQTTMVLKLIEAQTGLVFQPSEFEVPSN